MPSEQLISVVIPAYRAEATLPRAVHSLFAQTWASWEAVVASDDGVDYLAVPGSETSECDRCSPAPSQVARGAPATPGAPSRQARSSAISTRTTSSGPTAWRSWRRSRSLAAPRWTTPVCTGGTAPCASDPSPQHPRSRRSRRGAFSSRASRSFRCSGASSQATAGAPSHPRLCAAPAMVVHPESMYLYRKRSGSITEAPDTWQVAERGYAGIMQLLQAGAVRLNDTVRTAALAELTANRRLNRLFRHYVERGFAARSRRFDMSQNGRAPWVEAELARLSQDQAGAA